MFDIKNLKKKWSRKLAPHVLRELLRCMNLYSKYTGNGIGDAETATFSGLSKSVIDHYYHAYKEGAIWTSMFVPSEILFAMGLRPFSVEIAAALFSKFGQISQGFTEADLADIPTDVCSFHRAAIGLAYTGIYPPPLALAGTTAICDSNLKTIKICESMTGKKSFIVDVPYDFNDNSIKYVTHQLLNLTKFLEETTGKKMNKGPLAKAIELSNSAREKMLEVNNLRKGPLVSFEGQDALGFMIPSHLLIGSEYSVDFYTTLQRELQEQISLAKRNGTGPKEEIRLLWLELKPYFKTDLFDKISNAGNVRIVFEEINHVYWEQLDPDKPYESLARKMISYHNNGPLENRINVIKKLIKDYYVDGIIVFSTWGCRRNNAAIPTLKKELVKIGCPLLNLDGDCVDDSNYMSGQVATRVEGFIEMMNNRKKSLR